MSGTFPAPRALWPLLATAEAQAARQDWEGAIASYGQALQLAPRDAHTHVQLSYVHSLAGHYRLAREHARQAAPCNG